jgi:hypothetical protein
MSLMRAFCHDVESTVLSETEMAEFGTLVQFACHTDDAHALAAWLSGVTRPQPHSVQECAQRQARRMWRTELRV